MKQIQIDVYLKHFHKPAASVIVSKDEQVDELFKVMNSGDKIIRFYNIAFAITEFKYATINEKR